MKANNIVNICDVSKEIFAGGDAPKGNMSIEKTSKHTIPLFSNGEANDGLYGYTDFYRVSEPSITISARGTIGYATIRTEPFVPIVRLIVITPKIEIVDIKYLYYAIKNYDFSGRGTSIPQLTVPMLKQYSFPLPPLPEQRHIAAVLDKVSELIALRKRQLDLLDEMVKARFVEMFGDLIVNNLNWSQVQLSNVATTRLGKMLDAKKQTGKNTYPYLANFNVQWFQFKLDNLNQMDFDESDQIEFALEYGDLLVCEGGEVGRCAVWKNQVNNCFFQKALHRIRCDKSIIIPDYLAWWFKVHANYNSFDDIVGSKATIPHLTGIKLKQLMIEVPPIDLQNQFADFVQQVDKSKATVQQGLDRLNLLKSALMQEYFG